MFFLISRRKQINWAITALVTHTVETSHLPNFDDSEILATEQQLRRQLILQNLHIYCEYIHSNDTVNESEDIESISHTCTTKREREIKGKKTYAKNYNNANHISTQIHQNITNS